MSLDVMLPPKAATAVDFTVAPEFRDLLESERLTSCDAFFDFQGPIISGHPGRHVLRIEIGGQTCYLKREHQVSLRDRWSSWRAGWGFSSVSTREARTLDALRDQGVSVPRWIAFGESANGRAFLVLKAITGVESLRDRLSRFADATPTRRRGLARRLGRAIAAIHNRGFEYPDLYAKHVMVDSSGEQFSFLDWQRSSRGRIIGWRQRCRDLAALHASLPDRLADRDVRLTFLLAYLRASEAPPIDFRLVCRRIHRRSEILKRRGSLREQLLPRVRESQSLYWFNGEELCLTQTARAQFDRKEIEDLGYAFRLDDRFIQHRITVGGVECELTHRRTIRRWASTLDWFRGRRWQSPEALRAAHLLRRERLGDKATLLAFGQRRVAPGIVDSFLLCLPPPAAGGDS